MRLFCSLFALIACLLVGCASESGRCVDARPVRSKEIEVRLAVLRHMLATHGSPVTDGKNIVFIKGTDAEQKIWNEVFGSELPNLRHIRNSYTIRGEETDRESGRPATVFDASANKIDGVQAKAGGGWNSGLQAGYANWFELRFMGGQWVVVKEGNPFLAQPNEKIQNAPMLSEDIR